MYKTLFLQTQSHLIFAFSLNLTRKYSTYKINAKQKAWGCIKGHC